MKLPDDTEGSAPVVRGSDDGDAAGRGVSTSTTIPAGYTEEEIERAICEALDAAEIEDMATSEIAALCARATLPTREAMRAEIERLREEPAAVSWPNQPERAGRLYTLEDIGPLLDRAEAAERKLAEARELLSDVMWSHLAGACRRDGMPALAVKLDAIAAYIASAPPSPEEKGG